MSSKGTIEMNFQQAKEQANRLDEQAKRTKGGSKDLGTTMQGLSGGWTGENSKGYLGKGKKCETGIGNAERGLSQTATVIRQIAQRIYNAEMEALRIAQERSSK